jgi:hypothetical protein
MLSYWLDGNAAFKEVPALLAGLADRGLELSIEHQRDVWVIDERGRPKFVYPSLESLIESQSVPAPTHRHIESLWFVVGGDQWIFTSESEDEIRAFLAGLLATYLMEVGRPPVT